jgi:putative CocE/NonD family hydrolase
MSAWPTPFDGRLGQVSPTLEAVLNAAEESEPRYAAGEVSVATDFVVMRDGIKLATDIYRPPVPTAPVLLIRTPYDRRQFAQGWKAYAQRGWILVAQDCRATGDSEPARWDYMVFEEEDSLDTVDWIGRQPFFEGFLGALGGSYVGDVQFCIGAHELTTSIAPEVAGLGLAPERWPRLHMFINSYTRSMGNGADEPDLSYKDLERDLLDETLATGYYNEPLYREFSPSLVDRYPEIAGLPPYEAQAWLRRTFGDQECAQRAQLLQQAFGGDRFTFADSIRLGEIFGEYLWSDSLSLPRADKLSQLKAPALFVTGWYDWFLNDALTTWDRVRHEAGAKVREDSRLLIAPSAHDKPGYREGADTHPELDKVYRTPSNMDVLIEWYAAVREGKTDEWPRVVYYLMGANEWRAASDWPLAGAETRTLYLAPGGTLDDHAPDGEVAASSYDYDPADPTPTIGGAILSNVYTAGSCDVSAVQARPDVLSFDTDPLTSDLDIVGNIVLSAWISSSAVDTDFFVRVSDVFPDGRSIQLQSGALHARHRQADKPPELLVPGEIYPFEIELPATANRFMAGHRIRLDISSADFPKFERHSNRADGVSDPVVAHQTIYHDATRPSRVTFPVAPDSNR